MDDNKAKALQAALTQIYTTIDQLAPQNQKTLSWRPKRELYYYPLGGAVVFVLGYHLVMFVLVSLRRWKRREVTP